MCANTHYLSVAPIQSSIFHHFLSTITCTLEIEYEPKCGILQPIITAKMVLQYLPRTLSWSVRKIKLSPASHQMSSLQAWLCPVLYFDKHLPLPTTPTLKPNLSTYKCPKYVPKLYFSCHFINLYWYLVTNLIRGGLLHSVLHLAGSGDCNCNVPSLPHAPCGHWQWVTLARRVAIPNVHPKKDCIYKMQLQFRYNWQCTIRVLCTISILSKCNLLLSSGDCATYPYCISTLGE